MTTLVSAGLPVGGVIPFAGTIANIPAGFLLCDGSLLNRNDFPALFAAIGDKWGFDTILDFRLPTTQGLFIRGAANGLLTYDPNALTRIAIQTGGATGDDVGSYQADQFKSHNHGGGNHSHTAANVYVRAGTTNNSEGGFGNDIRSQTLTTNGSGTIISTQGGSQTNPHNITMNFIIKY